jgi:hypothetical protein
MKLTALLALTLTLVPSTMAAYQIGDVYTTNIVNAPNAHGGTLVVNGSCHNFDRASRLATYGSDHRCRFYR